MNKQIAQLGALQLALLKAGLVLRSQLTQDSKYEGIEQCRKNVVRCNRAKKLSYCLKQ